MSAPIAAYAYGTAREMAFIDRLRKREESILLLTGYLSAAAKRVNWGDIDGLAAVEYAQIQLREAHQVVQQ
ncbi:hypothetical protein [Cupriavidus sp. UYPR2.512]|uniref:hypothetical protein n=1 Tax=Cupriavidus sp. UYPR2.512 TaxID=1080187 RepID=UPI0012F7ADDF|nr:hypothetical protein [Cupriavidus sp. UYPR2.512]UIF90920.1 hypothetical protein KAF44_32560 [Cupriavidus necator]